MVNQWMERLKIVKNPATNRTLASEGRILGCELRGQELFIKYKRDGISPEDKRNLEEQIYQVFQGDLAEDHIIIETVSENSQEVYDSVAATQNNQQKAGLKVGHSSVNQPKKLKNIKHVIAVASGKGGVGKSTFTANLACSLANQGYKVGVIDADIYGPSIPMIMGARGDKPLASEDKKILPIEKFGVKFMSFGLFIEESDPVIWRGPMLGGVLNQFLFDVVWGELDYLIIDLPPGTGDIQLSLMQSVKADGAIIISTPQDIALLDAIKALEMFKKLKLPILGLVENMAYFVCDQCGTHHPIFGEQGVEIGAKKRGEKFLGSIPLELALREASDEGKPYMMNPENQGKAVWEAFTHVAKNLSDGNNKQKKSFLGLWKS